MVKDVHVEKFEKQFAKESLLSDFSIHPKRVSIIATIISLNPQLLEGVISDGLKEGKVFFKTIQDLEKTHESGRYRFLGRGLVKNNEVQLNVEIIQDAGEWDLGLYKKMQALERKVLNG